MIQDCIEYDDNEVKNIFRAGRYWGLESLINLKNCDKDIISSEDKLRTFVSELCREINMEMVGETVLQRFGHGHLYGYSLMQLISTSSIVGHFCEESGDAYIDIFSCKEFSPSSAALFCEQYFSADDGEYTAVIRDAGKS